MVLSSISIRNKQTKLQVVKGKGSLFLSSLRSRPERGNMPWVCWCLRLVLKAEAGKTALKRCPKETGRLNSHCLPQPLSGRFQLCATPQPIRFSFCFSTPSRRIRKESMGPSGDPPHASNLEVLRGPRPLSFSPPPPPHSAPLPHPQCSARVSTSSCAVAPPRGWGSGTAPGRDSRSHELPQLAGAPSPTDTPFLRRQPLATLCGAPASRSRSCQTAQGLSVIPNFRGSLSPRLSPKPHPSEERKRAGRGRQNSAQAPLSRHPSFPRPSPPPGPPRPCADPFYSPSHQRQGAQSLSGGMCLLIN
ncbi:keratinocyte proline-rich protein-like [Acinonyx jubatus]|uniref:Keratinocyte proline-rich protein-like n=1 Tax=Acinonyx jubatus TaxID=32536 RepID=A0ABM3NKM7_ACIJB|nr:keratinocyte proline-rich protein-like [Acinonyx jubatus]XP_053059955.1 keratinocyte proline-rich protein-like [Acinonyx jubatus]XP_053059957.1 keratinocyte proline-rich protein-like [Acinonyx jubatus]XP_053059960.1 keratinocyte proline-rich protein-like [Acinonyx jubatus]XP_053059964.1 keratinocyte proline-rich protein-like [Acinonyx jubatus]XP_053059967.1 keratinocyte proline-rich protein-like [Acinonyx jubatus]XP_053059971.1 keratinocyte proline-rich protein-like [Acinonyx jubatus]XP_0